MVVSRGKELHMDGTDKPIDEMIREACAKIARTTEELNRTIALMKEEHEKLRFIARQFGVPDESMEP